MAGTDTTCSWYPLSREGHWDFCIKNNAGTVFLHVICLPQIFEELPCEVDSIGVVLSNTSIPHY